MKFNCRINCSVAAENIFNFFTVLTELILRLVWRYGFDTDRHFGRAGSGGVAETVGLHGSSVFAIGIRLRIFGFFAGRLAFIFLGNALRQSGNWIWIRLDKLGIEGLEPDGTTSTAKPNVLNALPQLLPPPLASTPVASLT